MKRRKKRDLDGKALSASQTMAMLDFMNGGPEIQRLSHYIVSDVKFSDRNVGRIMVRNTGDDLVDNHDCKKLWDAADPAKKA